MVCATQEVNGNERQQQHHRQPIQLPHIPETSQPRQLISLAMQPTESQFTKIVFLSTPTTNINQNNVAQSSSSRQLKQQHSALVKLLESEPITKNIVTKKTGTNVGSADLLIKHQNDQECLNLKEKNEQRQHQLIHNISATQCKRLKSNGINLPLLVEHTTTRNHSVKMGTTCSFTINAICETKKHNCIVDNENNNVNKLKCKDLGVDDVDKKCIERITNIPLHSKLSIPQADVATFNSSNDLFEQCQCPWKKIRFAREWKQREQLQKKKQSELQPVEGSKQILTDEKLENNDGNTEGDITTLKSKGTVATPEFALSKQTENEITTLLKQQQQFRRDSSDSNSSLLSNSSTQSSASVNFCTCTPQQLKYQQDSVIGNDKTSSFCQFSDNHNTDTGCDDEFCMIHSASHPQSQLEQSAMNDLCQKFDDNLETFTNFTNEVNSRGDLNNDLLNSGVKNISHHTSSCKIDTETGVSDVRYI